MTHSTLAYTDEKGNLLFHDMSVFLDGISQRPNRYFEVIAKEIGHNTTDAQRGYYFAVVNRLCWYALKERGFDITEQQCHKWMSHRSLILKQMEPFINMETGELESREVNVSFSDAKKDMVSDYIDECIRWAAENLSIRIPPTPRESEAQRRITSFEDLINYKIV